MAPFSTKTAFFFGCFLATTTVPFAASATLRKPQLTTNNSLPGINSTTENNARVLVGFQNATHEQPRQVPLGCKPSDIAISQQEIAPGKGIWSYRRFLVRISNTCTYQPCVIQNIIVGCGYWTSAVWIDPKVFRRLSLEYGTCIVNNGAPMKAATWVQFEYGAGTLEPLRMIAAKIACSMAP